VKAALACVGLALVARHPGLTIALTAGLGAAVTGQIVCIVHTARKAYKS